MRVRVGMKERRSLTRIMEAAVRRTAIAPTRCERRESGSIHSARGASKGLLISQFQVSSGAQKKPMPHKTMHNVKGKKTAPRLGLIKVESLFLPSWLLLILIYLRL